MSDDERTSDMTIRLPAPRGFAEAVARNPDARAAEVLRALHRAKGTIVQTHAPTGSSSTEAIVGELRALREWLSTTSSATDATARRLGSCVTVLEQVVVVPSEKLAGFQRSQESVVRELRDAVHALKHQADVLVTWRAWWTRRLATFALVLALLLAGGIGLAWRAHALAKSTHQILAQILENQERAQAAKAGKRR